MKIISIIAIKIVYIQLCMYVCILMYVCMSVCVRACVCVHVCDVCMTYCMYTVVIYIGNHIL